MQFDNDLDRITPETSTVLTIGGTGALSIPIGTTAQRPASPLNGYLRFNTTTNSIENYNQTGAAWGSVGGGAAGVTGSIQVNNAGVLSSITNFIYNSTNSSLQIGAPSATLTNPIIQATDSVNSYLQVALQNTNAGTTASTDIVCTANTGTDTTNYIDMGIESSVNADPAFTITTPLDGYLYTNGGHLAVGTETTAKDVVVFAGGTLTANEVARFTNVSNATGKLRITNAATSTPVKLEIVSSTNNNGLDIITGGGSTLLKNNNGTTTVTVSEFISNGSTDVNYLRFTSMFTAGRPKMEAFGTDTNIGIYIGAKGTGTIQLGSNSAPVLEVVPVTTPINKLTVTSDTVSGGNIQLRAVNTDVTANAGITFNVTGSTSDFIFNSTTSLTVPIGTTAQRPAAPVNGMIRYNRTLRFVELYQSGVWVPQYASNGVRVASTANVTLATPGTTIDGITLATGDRILLKNQTATAENGVYIFNGAAVLLTRSADMVSWPQVYGSIIYVISGTVHAGNMFVCTAVLTGTIDTTSMTWTTFGGGGGGGSPGGTTKEVQYNNAGVFAGATNVEIDNNDLNLLVNASPTAPTSGIKLLAKNFANRILLAVVGPSGLQATLQPHIGRNRVSAWHPAGNSTTITAVGAVAMTAVGTATASNVAQTNMHTIQRRLDYLVTVAATNAVAGFRYASALWWIGHPTNATMGGFHYIFVVAPATGQTTATKRFFNGMASVVTAPTDVQPSTITNIIGIGYDSADANLQFMHRGTGAVTKIDLGANFVKSNVDRSKAYELIMFSPPGTTQAVHYQVTDLDTSATASGTITTNLPTTATALAPRCWASVGGTSSVIGVTLMTGYIETDF